MRRFRRTDGQPAAVHNRMVQIADHFLRQFLGEIHQHIAAEDDVHRIGVVRQRWVNVIGKIQIGKRHHLLDARMDFKASLRPRFEIALLDPGRCAAE